MNIIAVRTLRGFWREHPQTEGPLRVLYNRLTSQEWVEPREIRDAFDATVDFAGDNRVVFDVSGNRYRVIIALAYAYKRELIKFVGTHAQYEKVDAEEV